MRIENRVVLITGASDGIGAACARVFGDQGALLSLSGRSGEKLAAVARGNDLVTAADLTEGDAVEALVERTIEKFGRIDILINNAGKGIYWPVGDSPDSENRALFDLNFFAPLKLAQSVIPYMKRQGAGMIVNIGSIAGRVALPWMPLYSASKYAVEAVTESLRMELAADNIHVMLVSPGYVLTNFHHHAAGIAPPPRVVEGKRFAITPEKCARAILRGVERKARIVMTPRWGWFLVSLHRLIPRVVEAHLIQLNRSPLNHSAERA